MPLTVAINEKKGLSVRYCTECGASLARQIPAGDNRERHVCPNCSTIHYINPKIIVGCLATHHERILLCRRAIEPRKGLWTLPAGFMEMDESSLEGARRETLEEAGAEVLVTGLFSVVDVPHVNQVHLFFRGIIRDGAHSPGEESLETRLFAPDEIPWQELAFRSVQQVLSKHVNAIDESDDTAVHHMVLTPPAGH